jgi:membrane protein required for colicin V production
MFTLICVGLFFLAKLFTGLINMAALGVFNKILGAIFGLLKYAFIASVFLYFFNMLDARHHFLSADTKAESRLFYPVAKMSPALLPLMKEMKDKVSTASLQWEVKKTISETIQVEKKGAKK